MINRVLIRIRVIQVLYSYYQNQDGNIRKAESELQHSFEKTYDLYFYFLQLLVELTDLYGRRVDAAKSKLLPTEEDMNPNTKLLRNRFIKQLRDNNTLNEHLKNRPFSWNNSENLLKDILSEILSSDIYSGYIEVKSTYANDREFWRKIVKFILATNEELYNFLEDENLFWNDDIDITLSFVVKTIKMFDKDSSSQQPLMPMFKDQEDHDFAKKLLKETLFNGKEYREIISDFAKNWESERIAFIDQIIIQAAIAELLNFPSIPVNVTLNEYIDIAKGYSTEKSASFVNGLLDSIVNKFREEKRLIK
ncbi:MAG: transcription antitermination factor NusB [Dysgonomonas sp.]